MINYLNQVIPLFGDMQMSPFQYVKSSVQFDPSKWPLSNSATLSPQASFHFQFSCFWIVWLPNICENMEPMLLIDKYQANLLHNLEKMREDHIKYACELSR